ncbi:MAG TPA: transcription termination factor NusA [Thermoanaerobaculia bacterium]|jgi:N utilization substance protein A|nr:transcription termination factor NusA [Thermoanaerobaculia bacterium]
MNIDPSVIRQVSREKDIDAEKMFGALEEAMSSAARKFYHDKAMVTLIDRQTGAMTVYSPRTVVAELDTESEEPPPQILLDEAKELVKKQGIGGELRVLRPGAEGEPPTEVDDVQLGDEVRVYRETMGLGRIAAQTAKQVLYQKVREAERDNIYNEYFPKVGELMSGTVKRFERGDMIVDLGKSEAIIPRDQQSRAERYGQGERIRSILYDVHKNPKGPQLVLSRTDPRLLIRLFEMEVPEIYDGTVVIKGAVRQPGERAKVAVRSRERDVDPVGACVGMRGSRVQSIMRELHGEKIDVILYSDDLITFAQNALAPAKITRVSPIHHDDGTMSLDCVVEDDQLSLAIGKKGQNVRLASALIGMKIEIKGETEVKGEVAEALTRMLMASRLKQMPVADVPGITPKMAERLTAAEIATLSDLLEKSAAELAEIPGIGEATAAKILEAARAAEEDVRNPRPMEEEVEEEVEEVEEEAVEVSAGDSAESAGEEEEEAPRPAAETIVQE